MIRRGRRSGRLSGLTLVISLGLVIGVLYLALDNPLPRRAAVSTPTSEPTATRTAQAFYAPPPSPQPTKPPRLAREITSGARFFAPTAGIDTPVIESYLNGESWDIQDLGRYAGHLQGTAWMEETGNIVLAGHVEMGDGRKGVFATLHELDIGDPLLLTQGSDRRVYHVSEILSVDPYDLSALYPSSNDRLTLVTCTGYDFLQNTYHKRLVVIAQRVI